MMVKPIKHPVFDNRDDYYPQTLNGAPSGFTAYQCRYSWGQEFYEKEAKKEADALQQIVDSGFAQVTYEFELCQACKGTGNASRHECTDYHRREYSVFYDPCHSCHGVGTIRHKRIRVDVDIHWPEHTGVLKETANPSEGE